MFDDLWSQLISGGLGSLIFLLGFIGCLLYMNKVYVRKDSFKHHIKTNEGTMNHHVDQHEKDFIHLREIFEEKFEYIKNGIEEIRERLGK